MSKTLPLFYFCLIAVCYMSCTSNCEKLHLSDVEKSWVAHYKIGQQSFYKNQLGQIDTLEIKDTSNYYTPCNKFELSEYQYEIYMVIFKFKSKSNYALSEPSISITTEEWQQKIPYITLCNLGLRKNDLENKMPVAIDTVLNGVKLTSVYYYAKGLNTEQYGEKGFFKNFFWSKELGLMAYTTVKDEVFLRVNK